MQHPTMPGAPDLPPMPPPAAASQPAPAQPHSSSPQSAAPARSLGTRRLRQAVLAIGGGGFGLVLAVCGGELVLRDGLRPTDLMATIEARTELGIFNQKMGAEPGQMLLTEADYQKALAQAQREGQAKAELAFQKELSVVQSDKERVVAAYQTLYSRANLIAQAALQMETVAQQFRQQLLTMTNGGRATVIGIQDMLCAIGSQPACEAAKAARAGMIAEADELSRGDVGNRVRELMAGVDDPATLIAREDRRQHGTPALER